MIITHRSGDPEEMSDSSMLIKIASVSGVHIAEKALVTEDHLIEIAGWRRIFKCSQMYDVLKMPR